MVTPRPLRVVPVTGPVTGIVGHRHLVPKPFGELPVTGTPQAYVDALLHVGARPVIVPPRAGLDLLDLVDGLVLTGGGDVDPARYGAPGTAYDVDGERDDAEIALVRRAADARIPVLGVCRGLQVLAVTFGGTLVGGHDHNHPLDGHDVRTAPGSLIHELLGERVRTSALHRQAVGDPGAHWRPTAWTEDGTVEAIEPVAPDWPVLGVQWHPSSPGTRRSPTTPGPRSSAGSPGQPAAITRAASTGSHFRPRQRPAPGASGPAVDCGSLRGRVPGHSSSGGRSCGSGTSPARRSRRPTPPPGTCRSAR